MPMNEYGEIERSGSLPNRSNSPSLNNNLENRNNGTFDSFSSQIERQFYESKKKSFNRITLAIGVPIYAIIGYLVAEQYLYNEVSGMTGAVIAGILSAICISVYNKKWAKKFEGYEYLVSLLSAIVAVAILSLFFYGFIAIFGIVLIVAIIAGLLGS